MPAVMLDAAVEVYGERLRSHGLHIWAWDRGDIFGVAISDGKGPISEHSWPKEALTEPIWSGSIVQIVKGLDAWVLATILRHVNGHVTPPVVLDADLDWYAGLRGL